MHVDDWAFNSGAVCESKAERDAKAWVREYRKPAHECDHAWIESVRVTAKYSGRRYRVVMASRMGDIGLSRNMDQPNGYTKRVSVDDLTGWNVEHPETPTDD